MKLLTIKTPAGETWGVPVEVIARHRATTYAHEFGDDITLSLKEDTEPLFASDAFEVEDWATNNMNWSDVAQYAVKLRGVSVPDLQEAWMNGEKAVIDAPEPQASEEASDGAHEHDAEFLGLALLVALGMIEANEIVLTAENIEAAMHFGLISDASKDGETVRVFRASREETEALMATTEAAQPEAEDHP